MSLAYKFKFFDHLIWIDSNSTISLELNQFIMIYGNQFQFYQNPTQAKICVEKNQNSNYLVMCNSKFFLQVYTLFSQLHNVYPKFIVFCGSSEKANQMENEHLYKNAVEKALWEVGDIIDRITTVDIAAEKKPGILSEKIKIVQQALKSPNNLNLLIQKFLPNFQVPPIGYGQSDNSAAVDKKNLIYGSGNGYNMFPQPSSSYENNSLKPLKNAPIESSQVLDKIYKNEAGVAIQKQEKEEKPKSQYKKNEEKKQKKKVSRIFKEEQNTKICWVLDHEISKSEDEDLKKNYFQQLQDNGYPIDLIQSAENIVNYVQSQVDYNYIIIAKGNFDIQNVQASTNNNLGTIRLCIDNDTDYQYVTQNETIVTNLEEMLSQLKKISTNI